MWPATQPATFCLWGHEHYSHTHSYIHYGFYKAAKSLGWSVEWISNTPANGELFKSRNTDGWLFLTEGQVDTYMPKNENAFYILHNCDQSHYLHISLNQKLVLQVYTNDCLSDNVVHINDKKFEYWTTKGNVFYMPWATDLLPSEIDENIRNLSIKTSGEAVFVGTHGDGVFGNCHQISPFKKRCVELHIPFKIISSTRITQEDSISHIKTSFLAPTIVGAWQKSKGYIPCRIFKTVSYGQLGITNSKEAFEAIDCLGVFNSNEANLVNDSLEKIMDPILRKTAMEYIRDNHTYINRLDSFKLVFMLKQLECS